MELEIVSVQEGNYQKLLEVLSGLLWVTETIRMKTWSKQQYEGDDSRSVGQGIDIEEQYGDYPIDIANTGNVRDQSYHCVGSREQIWLRTFSGLRSSKFLIVFFNTNDTIASQGFDKESNDTWHETARSDVLTRDSQDAKTRRIQQQMDN